MGSKYTTQSASGYNSSPPADDGSQTASNLTTWAGVKTKLGDPVKTLADNINTALVTAFDYSVRQITAADSITASDHMRTVEIAPTVSAAVSVTLADAATLGSNFLVRIRNSSTISHSITRATGGDTIDGTAQVITLPSKASVTYTTNAAASGFLTLAYSGPKIDTDPIVVGGTDGTKKIRFEVDGLTTGTTRVVTVPDADVTIATAAAQSDQETATSTTTYVSPGRQHFHPAAAKAWGLITHATTVTTSYPAAGVSVTNPGTGQYVVTHGLTMSSTSYAVLVTGLDTTARVCSLTARDATTFTVQFLTDAGAAEDMTSFSYVIYGDL